MGLFDKAKPDKNKNGSRNRELTYNITCPECDKKQMKDIWAIREGYIHFTCVSCKTIFNVHIPNDLSKDGSVGVGVIRRRNSNDGD